MFILGILEEIFRIILALYVCYLITFDVHAVNNSYVEDVYFQTCRAAGDKQQSTFYRH